MHFPNAKLSSCQVAFSKKCGNLAWQGNLKRGNSSRFQTGESTKLPRFQIKRRNSSQNRIKFVGWYNYPSGPRTCEIQRYQTANFGCFRYSVTLPRVNNPQTLEICHQTSPLLRFTCMSGTSHHKRKHRGSEAAFLIKGGSGGTQGGSQLSAYGL